MGDYDGEPTLAGLLSERNCLQRDIEEIKKYHGEPAQKTARLKEVNKQIKGWGKDPSAEARVY